MPKNEPTDRKVFAIVGTFVLLGTLAVFFFARSEEGQQSYHRDPRRGYLQLVNDGPRSKLVYECRETWFAALDLDSQQLWRSPRIVIQLAEQNTSSFIPVEYKTIGLLLAGVAFSPAKDLPSKVISGKESDTNVRTILLALAGASSGFMLGYHITAFASPGCGSSEANRALFPKDDAQLEGLWREFQVQSIRQVFDQKEPLYEGHRAEILERGRKRGITSADVRWALGLPNRSRRIVRAFQSVRDSLGRIFR